MAWHAVIHAFIDDVGTGTSTQTSGVTCTIHRELAHWQKKMANGQISKEKKKEGKKRRKEKTAEVTCSCTLHAQLYLRVGRPGQHATRVGVADLTIRGRVLFFYAI